MAFSPSERKAAREHLLRLARRHGIEIAWRPERRWYESECHVGHRIMWVREPKILMDYLAALHEFGHMVCPRAAAAGNHIATEEAAAWDWALAHMPRPFRQQLTGKHYDLMGGAWASCLRDRW